MTLDSLPVIDVYIAFNPTYSGTTLATANQQALPASGASNSYWTNCLRVSDGSGYVREFTTKSGKQHYLDRIEAATLQITMDNRDGFFFNGGAAPGNGTGYVLQTRMPIAVTATPTGYGTYPVYWGLIDSIEERITDEVNSDLLIQASDLTKYLSLKYMSDNAFWSGFAQSANATNWYRCTQPQTFAVTYGVESGGTITYTALNNLTSGDAVTISGLGVASGTALNFHHVATTSASSTGFTINTPAGVTAGSKSSGTGSAYRTQMLDMIGSANGMYSGVVSFQTYGAQIYDTDGCVDSCNGGSTPTGQLVIPQTGSITAGGIDFWILGQGLAQGTWNHVGAIAVIQTSPRLWLTINSAGLLGVATASGNAVGSVKIDDGFWHHIGIVKNGTDLQGYVDGTFFALDDALTSFTMTNSGPDYDTSVLGVLGGLIGPPTPACFDEIVVSSTSVTVNEVLNRYVAGTLLQLPTNVTGTQVRSGDRIAEILALSGFGTVTAGALTLNANTYYINDGSVWSGYSSGNGYAYVEPYYWDTPITNSTALDLILQVCDTDIGVFFQKPDGTLSFYNQNYFGTWTWTPPAGKTPGSGSWSPVSYSTDLGFVWADVCDDADIANGVVPYYGPTLQVLRDDADLWTSVRITPQAGVDQIWETTASEAQWGYTTLTKSGTVPTSLTGQGSALSAAAFLAYLFRSPLPRVGNVELRSESFSSFAVLAMVRGFIGTMVEFKRTSPNASTSGSYPDQMGQIDAFMVIESVSWDFQAEPGYLHVSYTLDPYAIRI